MRVFGTRVAFALIPILFALTGCGGGGSTSAPIITDPDATPSPGPTPIVASPSPSPSPIATPTPILKPGDISKTTPSPNGEYTVVHRLTTKTPVGSLDYFLKLNGSDTETLIGEAGEELMWSANSGMVVYRSFVSAGDTSFIIVKIEDNAPGERINGSDYRNAGIMGKFKGSVRPLSFSDNGRVLYFKVAKTDDITGAYSEVFYSFDLPTRLYAVGKRPE